MEAAAEEVRFLVREGRTGGVPGKGPEARPRRALLIAKAANSSGVLLGTAATLTPFATSSLEGPPPARATGKGSSDCVKRLSRRRPSKISSGGDSRIKSRKNVAWVELAVRLLAVKCQRVPIATT